MTTLREAAQAALDLLRWQFSNVSMDIDAENKRASVEMNLRAALAAEPAQPVAWFQIHNGVHTEVAAEYKDDPDVFPLFAAPQPPAAAPRLSDADIKRINEYAHTMYDAARAVEAEVRRRMGVAG